MEKSTTKNSENPRLKPEAAAYDYTSILGKTVSCTIDRPLGTIHPKHPDICYLINYGYVNGIFAGDGEEQDVYIIGEDKPLQTFTGIVIGIYHRYNDKEDKWIVSSGKKSYTRQEILDAVSFQEKFFDGVLIL